MYTQGLGARNTLVNVGADEHRHKWYKTDISFIINRLFNWSVVC